MKSSLRRRLLTVVFIGTTASFSAVNAAEWQVTLPASNTSQPDGRLLLLVKPDDGKQPAMLSTNGTSPGGVSVAAQEVTALAPGASISIDASTAYKTAFTDLPPGKYLAMALLDRDHSYNFEQSGPGDLHSPVQSVSLPLTTDAVFTLSQEVAAPALWEFPGSSEQDQLRREAVRPRLQEFSLKSEQLSTFRQQDTSLQAWVLLPKDYAPDTDRTWPVIYMTGTFSATHKANLDLASLLDMFDVSNEPSMIWVFLDFQTPYGPTLFVDSDAIGPWGSALVEEFIPALEQRYRMDARPNGRFLIGHSSGGWTSAWLQTHFPAVFGGSWSTAPDPLDFTAFLKTDLYSASANVYTDAAGVSKGVARRGGVILTTIEDTAHYEDVLGPQGGVFQAMDWAFSPRDAAGNTRPLFDLSTGAVDPAVAAYWREHFDLSVYLTRNWATLQPALDGKLHFYVGTADDHYLEDSVYKLRDTLNGLGANAEFEFHEGKTHNNLYVLDKDPVGLMRRFSKAMYAIARPDAEAGR
ncbi:MAG: enterochelin esterase [Pseudomonadota bacterium]